MKNRDLPPLNAIKTFEAVARHLSMTKAAAELCVTQSAVSKQINNLEQHLAVKLLDHKTMTLTEKGSFYALSLRSILDELESATRHITEQDKQEYALTINALPSLAQYWLMPKINDFKLLHPHIKLHINTGDGFYVDADNNEADIFIRCNSKPFPDVENIALFDEIMIPICHRDLWDANQTDNKGFENQTLLIHTGRPDIWHQWAQCNNVTLGDTSSMPHFEHFFLVIDAVKNKLGIGFVPAFLVHEVLLQHDIINPLNIQFHTGYCYYAMYRHRHRFKPNIRAFLAWLSSL